MIAKSHYLPAEVVSRSMSGEVVPETSPAHSQALHIDSFDQACSIHCLAFVAMSLIQVLNPIRTPMSVFHFDVCNGM